MKTEKNKDVIFHSILLCISMYMICSIIYFVITLPWYITLISVISGIIIVTNFDKISDALNDCFRTTL